MTFHGYNGPFDYYVNQKRARNAYKTSQSTTQHINSLEERLMSLEEYFGLEWSECNGKYYKTTDSAASKEDGKES